MPWCAASAGRWADPGRAVSVFVRLTPTARLTLFQDLSCGQWSLMAFLLWILAVLLVIAGVVNLFQGQILIGVLLIVVGLAVGPGGYSIFNRQKTARA